MPALRGKKLAEEILSQADRLEGKFRTAYLRSVLKLADDKELKKLLDDIDKGKFSFGDSVDARLNNVRIDVAEMNEIARQAIAGSAKITNQVMGLKGSFEVVNDSVIDAAKKLSVDLSTNLTRTAKESLRQIIEDQLAGNISRQEAVRRITMEVGLLPQHAKAVSNYRKTLISAGTPRGQANKMAEQYAKRLLKYRANMIARTEVARATGIGQTNFWRQMRDQGALPPSTNRIWITAMDERACEFCLSMNGEIATIDGGWDTPKGYMEYPQASHPHCRCSSGITTSRPTKAGRAGRIAKVEEIEYDLWLSKVGDKPGHPFRGNQYTQANKHAKEIDKKLRAVAGDKVADTWKPLVQEAMTTWYGQGDMQAPITVKGKKILVGGREISTQGVLDTMADALGVNAISQGRGFGADDVFSKGDKPGHPFRGNQWTGGNKKGAVLGEYGGVYRAVGAKIDLAIENEGFDSEAITPNSMTSGGRGDPHEPSELARALFEVSSGGLSTKLTNVDVAEDSSRGGYASVNGLVLDSNGKQVGYFSRTMNFEDGQLVSVDHNHFEVEQRVQASGIGAELFNNSVAGYDYLGAGSVTTLANIDVGGYAWAKAGFDFADKDTRITTLGSVEHKLGELAYASLDKPTLKRELRYALGISQIATIDTSSLTPQQTKVVREAQKAEAILTEKIGTKWTAPFMQGISLKVNGMLNDSQKNGVTTPLEVASLGIERAIKVRIPRIEYEYKDGVRVPDRVEYLEMSIWPGKYAMLGESWEGVLQL